MANDPDYKGTSFPSFKKDYSKIKKKKISALMHFVMKMT